MGTKSRARYLWNIYLVPWKWKRLKGCIACEDEAPEKRCEVQEVGSEHAALQTGTVAVRSDYAGRRKRSVEPVLFCLPADVTQRSKAQCYNDAQRAFT
jgi:hypothetical protein